MEAIFGTRGGSPNIAAYIHYNAQKLEALNSQDNFCGKGFWGYGINSICDGKQSYNHLDVEEIKNTGGLNKHHEPDRNLLLLTFKVEKENLFVSTFSIDSCTAGVNSDINTKYDLKYFENARIVTRNNKIIVEFIFKGIDKPISFQVDDYHFPQNLSGGQLAKYYIDTMKELSSKILLKKEPETASEQKLDEAIEKTEKRLREIVVETLCQKMGERDYEVLITGEVKNQIRNRIKEHVALHPNLQVGDFNSIDRAIQFCDIDHMKKIIIKDIYWNHFENVFKEKEKVVKYFEGFNNLRKAVMHNREVSMLVRHEGNAAIEWLNMAMF
jgi:hypothetical protein